MSAVHPEKPIVFRSTFGIVLTLVVWAICAAGIVSAFVSGAGVTPVVLLATLGWFVWLAYWRPAVVTDAAGVEFRNLVSDVRIPYDTIDDVDTRFSLRVGADGRTWSAWGAPAPGGAGALRDSMRRPRSGDSETWRDAPRSVREAGTARKSDAVDSASGAPATVIRRELERRERDGVRRDRDARVTVHRRTTLVAASIALPAASVVALLVG